MKKHVEQKALEAEAFAKEAEAFAKEAKEFAKEALKRALKSYKCQREVLGDPASIAELDVDISSLEETIRQMEE